MILRSLLGFVSKSGERDGERDGERASTHLGFRTKKQHGMLETGVETALVLGDKRRRKQWTRDVSQQFPWIPKEMLSVCVDGLATAFATIAPTDLKRALQQPGGLEKTRSKVGADVVRNLQAQPIIQQLPLPRDDKRKLLTQLVDFSLEFFLRDVESAMASPSVKLRALDRQRRELQTRMSVWERILYRLRYQPKTTTVCVGLLSLWTVWATLAIVRQTHTVSAMTKHSKSMLVSIGGWLVPRISNTKRRVLNFATIHMKK